MNAAAAALPGLIGAPVETMVLDVQLDQQTVKPCGAAETLLRAHPARTQILFAYYASLHCEAGRVCVSFSQASAACVVTISLPDMAIAHDPEQVVAICLGLHAVGGVLAGACVVAAGGEIELDAELGSPARALANAMDPQSLAQWVACDDSLMGHQNLFQVVRRAGNTLVLKRA
jgi:hypothetical protein